MCKSNKNGSNERIVWGHAVFHSLLPSMLTCLTLIGQNWYQQQIWRYHINVSANESFRGCEWRHAPEARAEDFGDFENVSWIENKTPNRKGRFSGLAEARRICALRAPHLLGVGRWKIQNRKNVYLSPYVEEPLNSKVIKSFVSELRSHVFRVSGFLCSMYICNEYFMYVSHIHVWLFTFWSLNLYQLFMLCFTQHK